MDATDESRGPGFIRDIIEGDIKSGKLSGSVVTRFPPEPNGYLHIGHAKSIFLNFGIAQENEGTCNLRIDDTNPVKEAREYVAAIKEDVRWLGWDCDECIHFTSDYFEELYGFAVDLIKKELAYVDDLSQEEIRESRGTLIEPGKDSIYRDRSVEDNLDLFRRMRAGEFDEGSRVLRAKIDMKSANLNMRDPVIYRVIKASHHRTGDKWCVYPMYDFAHGQSDSIEGVTHSLCTMEFEDHRPLYEWFLDALAIHHPRQIEFARLNLTHTILSKRKLSSLVEEGYVSGWDDPRMPTLAGLRRRGYTPRAISAFCDRVGVAKRQNTVEIALLEHSVREDLNRHAQRTMGVLSPMKVVIDNYPEELVEELEAINNPEDPAMGTRKLPFSRELYIERDDFLEDPPEKFFRLAPGREVRLRYGYFVTCVSVDKDQQTGEILALHCTYDPETRGGQSPDGRRPRGTIHWVSVPHSLETEVRLYNHLFTAEWPDEVEDYRSVLNPQSVEILKNCRVEASLANAQPGTHYQFERMGYFCVDVRDARSGAPIFNRTVTLRDTWAKLRNVGS